MNASLMTRVEELEDKKRSLKKLYAEERLKSEVTQRQWQKRGKGL
jgi:putative transposase